MNTEDIARVCYEADRAYNETMGDDQQPEWEHAAEQKREMVMALVDMHLHSGENVKPDAGHKLWMERKEAAGWKHGSKKDNRKKTDPFMVPYKDLQFERQVPYVVFQSIVQSLKRHLA